MDKINFYLKNELADLPDKSAVKNVAKIIVKREKIVKTDEVQLPVDHISNIEFSYKYISIPQSHRNNSGRC